MLRGSFEQDTSRKAKIQSCIVPRIKWLHTAAGWDPASDALATALADLAFPIDLPARLESVERELILRALRQTGFNRTAAAPLLGLNFRQLRYRIQQLEIRDEREGRDGRDDSESMAEGEGRDA